MRVLKETPYLPPIQNAIFAENSEWPPVLKLRKIFTCREVVESFSIAHRQPPFTTARLYRGVLTNPTEVFLLEYVRRKPGKLLTIKPAISWPIGHLILIQQINFTALENSCTLV